MSERVDIYALWDIYRCDYLLKRAERDELWDALSKQTFLGTTTEKEICELIESYLEATNEVSK
jgi:hypothetical protein